MFLWPAAPAPRVLGVLDVAVLCLGLEVDPGSAGSTPGPALH